MTLWRFEARKMFKMNRGVLIAVLFTVTELALIIFGDTPANMEAELCREQYLHYLNIVDGPWTREKAEFLEAEAAKGPEDVYAQGFDVVYDQYRFVSEGKENRYFLDANGWAGLLAERGPDLPLMAAVILLCVPVYCGEEADGMEPLALTSRCGKKLFLRYKIVLALSVTAGLSLSSDLMRLLFCAARYGLPHSGYPMQSVELFGTAAKELPLWGAEAAAVILRLLGALELAALTLCVSALCGQFALSAFLASAAAVLPWMAAERSVRYSLPFPSSLLAPAGFLMGSEYETNLISGESAVIFREVGWEKLAAVVTVAVLAAILCVLLIRRRYRTGLSGVKRTGPTPAALCLALTLGLALSGCGRAEEAPIDLRYNSLDNRTYTYNGVTVTTRGLKLSVTDSEGNPLPLAMDALAPVNGAEVLDTFFAAGRYVYFWTRNSEGYSEKLGSHTGRVSTVSLIRLDLDTFRTEVVFEDTVQYTVFGIGLAPGKSVESLGLGGPFIVAGEYVYRISGKPYRLNLRTGKTSRISVASNRNVAFDGRYIYYISPDRLLTAFDTRTEETSVLRPDPVSDFRLTEDGLTVTELAENQ